MPEKRILADEHISKTVVKRLKSFGIKAHHVSGINKIGATDTELIEYAKKEECIILTRDDDFRKLSRKNQVGVILQEQRQTRKQTAADVIKVLNSIEYKRLQDELIYIPWE